MYEFGLETSRLKQLLSGEKTVEIRLGTPKFLKFRTGNTVSVREDIWQDDAIVQSVDDQATIRIKQLLYFESFEELFSAVSYSAAIPEAESKADALRYYRRYYSAEDEYEYGVIAMTFELVS